MNVVLDDVAAAFERIAVHPRPISVDRKGVALPKGGHFQGIQRVDRGPRLVITSSSGTQAYFVICDMTADGSRGRANAPVRMATAPLKHAGGCQTLGSILATGVEDDDLRRTSEIQFWNLAEAPVRIDALSIKRAGPPDVSTAGAVGLTAHRNGIALAVATWNAATIDFYSAPADPFRAVGVKFQFRGTWTKSQANKSGWIDGNFGAYQSVNLLSQRDGRLFLVAFNRSGGDDWMDLFSVDPDAALPSMLKKIAKKHMFCTDGCSFEFGAGVDTVSSGQFEVYAVKGESGDHATGTIIRANHFARS
jgi:hypothetical protein